MTGTPDQLLLTDRVKIAIQLGEGHFREFKSAWDRSVTPPKPRSARDVARDMAEVLVGFANADGGELLIGVEDDGRITSVPHVERELEIITQAPKTHVLSSTPLVGYSVSVITIDSSQVVYFQISKSTTQIHQTSDGRCLQRLNTENRPVPLEQIRYERMERRSREYDREFVDGASIADLDQDLLRDVTNNIMRGTALDRGLQYLDLLAYDRGVARLRRAALLLFAHGINQWHPRCQVRILRILGNKLEVGWEYNVKESRIIQGNILNLVNDTWNQLRPYLATERFAEGALFRESFLYPEEACREAIINAIVHRDYSMEGSGIEIRVFNDRMEIESPGGLLSDISLSALRRLEKVHQSRNSYIARVLRELGYIKELGEGIPRIFKTVEDYDLLPPELDATPSSFSITLHHKSVFSSKDRAWLESFQGIPLTRDEQRVLLLARDRKMISPAEIMKFLGIVDTDQYRQLVEKMQYKSVLFSARALTQVHAKSRKHPKTLKKREIPRLSARDPQECARFLDELILAVWQAGIPSPASPSAVSSLTNRLSPNSPFRRNPLASLVALELIDEERRPTVQLLELFSQIKPKYQRVVATSQKAFEGKQVGTSEQARPLSSNQLSLLLDEIERLIANTSRKDSGASLRSIRSNLSSNALNALRAFKTEADLTEFLSRQQDRFELRWVGNTFVVYSKQKQQQQ